MGNEIQFATRIVIAFQRQTRDVEPIVIRETNHIIKLLLWRGNYLFTRHSKERHFKVVTALTVSLLSLISPK